MSGTEAQDIEHRCKMCGRLREHLEEGRGDEVHYSNISLPDTEAAAKSGCVFCLFLVSAVTRVHRHSNIPIVGDTFSYSYRGTSGMTLRIGHSKKYPGYDDLDLVDFNVYTTSESCPWPEIKIGRVTGGYSGSPEKLSLIKRWVEECCESHSDCHQDDTPLPTRIIDLGLSCESLPRLVSGRAQSARYCALSHCWGSSQPVRTTKLNISRMESRLPRLLTKTFRDAITITRSLSVQYLWIDSLCIIQDDKQDWEKESGLMASIYENAYLVISAAHASDGSKGCFSEHPAPKETLTPFYSHITLDGSSIPFYLRHETQISHQAYQSNTLFILWESSVPLHFRAWALQERILATRIVHFTDEELVWECHKSVRCECMSMDHDSSHINNPLLKQLWRVGIRGDDHSPGPKYNRFSIWHTILETYTRLDITKPSDRLPALSGLAKKMQGAGAGNYLAGLWENNLLCDLLWMGGTYSTNTKRAGTWQSPSWSWAGLQLEPDEWISHTFSNYAVVAGTTISLNTHNLMLAAKNEMATTVNKIECKAAGYDETGEVSQGASLTISAPTISVSAIANLKQDRNCKMEIHKGGQVLHFKADCMADFSSNDHDKGTFNLVCVWIGTIRFEDWILPQTIVLRRSNGIGGVAATPNAYERVGVLYPMGYPNNSDAETITEWFKDAELRVVKIV